MFMLRDDVEEVNEAKQDFELKGWGKTRFNHRLCPLPDNSPLLDAVCVLKRKSWLRHPAVKHHEGAPCCRLM